MLQEKLTFSYAKKKLFYFFTCSSVEDCSFFSSLITDVSLEGDFSELVNGVRRVKKFIRVWVLYRSRIALTSVFVGGAGGLDVDEDAVGVREVVFEFIRLVGVDFDAGVCEEGGSLDLDAFVALEEDVTVRLDVGFGIDGVFAKRCEVVDVEEWALTVDDGLIERLRAASDDACACCIAGVAGRGIKPKRGCVVLCEDDGSDGRFVVDIGRVEPRILNYRNNGERKRSWFLFLFMSSFFDEKV
jgi:hypothetical protein